MRTKSTNSAIFPILFGFFVMGFVDVVGIATNYVKMDFGLSDTACFIQGVPSCAT